MSLIRKSLTDKELSKRWSGKKPINMGNSIVSLFTTLRSLMKRGHKVTEQTKKEITDLIKESEIQN